LYNDVLFEVIYFFVQILEGMKEPFLGGYKIRCPVKQFVYTLEGDKRTAVPI
jgi:hypothetical protein